MSHDTFHWIVNTTHKMLDSIPNDTFYQITADLKIKPHNLLVDCFCGLAKHAIFYGKWGGAVKLHAHSKSSISTQYILSQQTLLRCFNHLDGFSNFTTIFDVFLKTHKFMLYNFFGKDEHWDNEILLNAILRYFPICIPKHILDNEDELAIRYKAMFLLLSKVQTNPSTLIDNAKEAVTKVLNIFESSGIILFVKYMQSWRHYLYTKRVKEQIACDTEELSENLHIIKPIMLRKGKSIKNKKQFWKIVYDTISPLQTYVLKKRFIDDWEFEDIAKDLDKSVEEVYENYQNALLTLKERLPEQYANMVYSRRC